MLEKINERVRDFLEDLATNGQLGRARNGKVQYVFDPNRGAPPGSFVPVRKIKGQLEPKDIILNYTEHDRGSGEKEIAAELEQFGKPISERIVGTIYGNGQNENYYHIIEEMRKLAGDHVVD